MDIYIKTFNSESENPTVFTLSSNIGSITPSTASLNELLDGKIFSLSDENATQITLSAQGFESKAVNINKEAANCFQTSAANYVRGNTRPTTSNEMLAPFRTQYVDPSIINNIFNLNVGDEFSIQIFENLVTFAIADKKDYPTISSVVAYQKNIDLFDFDGTKNTETGFVSIYFENKADKTFYFYSQASSLIREWA